MHVGCTGPIYSHKISILFDRLTETMLAFYATELIRQYYVYRGSYV